MTKSSIAPGIGATSALLLFLAVSGAGVLPGALAQSVPATAAPSVPAAGAASSTRQPLPSQESVRAQALAIAEVRKHQRAKHFEEALRAAQRGVRRHPTNTQLRFLLGVTLADTGNTEQAIATFDALSQDHPELAEPYNNLAVIHAANGNLDAARAALMSAIRVVPDYPLALENLGDIYLRMAQQSYQRAVDLGKPTPVLRRKLSRASALVQDVTSTAAAPGQ